MAKRKSLRSLTEEIQSSNSSVNDSIKSLDERVRFLEDTSLAIIALVKKIQQPKITNTKSLRTVAPKDKNSPASDPLISKQNDNTSDGLLTKIYMFLVKKSDIDKRERNRRLKSEKEKEKQIEKRYEKVFKSMGFKRKKGGMIGKVWTGIKWGAIGAGLSGLVWLFKEEITKFGTKLKDSVKEFGNFLQEKFGGLKKIYDGIYGIFYSLYERLLEPLVQKFKSTDTFESISKQIDNVYSFVEKTYDDVIKWVVDILKPLWEFSQSANFSDPTKLFDNFKGLATVFSVMGVRAAGKLAGVAVGGLAGKGIDIASDVGVKAYVLKSGYDYAAPRAKEILNRLQYGNKYYDDIKKVVDGMTDKEIYNKFGTMFMDDWMGRVGFATSESHRFTDEEKRKIINTVIEDPELLRRLGDPRFISGTAKGGAEAKQIQMKYDKNTLYEQSEDDRRKREIQKIQSEEKTYLLERLKDAFPDQGWFAELDNNGQWFFQSAEREKKGETPIYLNKEGLETLRMILRGQVISALGEQKLKAKSALEDFQKTITQDENVKKVKEGLKDVKKYLLTTSKDVGSDIDTMKSTASQYYEGANTPQEKVASTVRLAGRGFAEMGDLFINKARPSAEKIDMSKIISKSIDAMDQSFTQASELSKMIERPGGMKELIDKLMPGADTTGQLLPEMKRDNISPDPNEDPNNIWKGIQESWAMPSISNNVMNAGKSSSQSISQGSISSRMNTGSFRECSALNYHACVP